MPEVCKEGLAGKEFKWNAAKSGLTKDDEKGGNLHQRSLWVGQIEQMSEKVWIKSV